MDALLADSPTVPGLLTEYILKGECKAASDIGGGVTHLRPNVPPYLNFHDAPLNDV